MYRKQDPNQLMLEGFVTPFGKLAAGNRWVKQAELNYIPMRLGCAYQYA